MELKQQRVIADNSVAIGAGSSGLTPTEGVLGGPTSNSSSTNKWKIPGNPSGNAMWQGYPMQDCIGMKTANNLMQPGWLASQADVLAEDWEIVK